MSVRTGHAGRLRFIHQRRPQRKAAALCGAARSAASSGGGISALRLVRSVHSCAMLAKSAFFLETKMLCPAAASGVCFVSSSFLSAKKINMFPSKLVQTAKHVFSEMCRFVKCSPPAGRDSTPFAIKRTLTHIPRNLCEKAHTQPKRTSELFLLRKTK